VKHHVVRVSAFGETTVEIGKPVSRRAPETLKWGSPRHDQIPAPPSNDSRSAFACVIVLPGGTLRVSQTLPPIYEPLPIVTRPRMVAPA
jgi:hypothetical protein